MSKDGLKAFFGMWYGKVVLAVITAIAVTGTLFLGSVPYRSNLEAFHRIEKLEDAAQATSVRLKGIETNVEWIVRRMGGNP